MAIIFVDLGQAKNVKCVGTTETARFFEISENLHSAIQRSVSVMYLVVTYLPCILCIINYACMYIIIFVCVCLYIFSLI